MKLARLMTQTARTDYVTHNKFLAFLHVFHLCTFISCVPIRQKCLGKYRRLDCYQNQIALHVCLNKISDTIFSEETSDERTFRNWMNSLGVSPRVNRIYG